jgi:hypothetical protein
MRPCKHSGIQLAQDATIAQHDGAVEYKLRHGAGNGLDGEPKVVGNVFSLAAKSSASSVTAVTLSFGCTNGAAAIAAFRRTESGRSSSV